MILCCFRIRVSVKPWGCSCNYHFHMHEIKRPKVFASNVRNVLCGIQNSDKSSKKIPNKPNYKSSEKRNKTQSYAKSHSRTLIIFSIQQIKLADVNVI